MLRRSASGVSGASGSRSLATGTDSPVSAASAICSAAPSRSRASAATASPAASSRMSPGTTSRASTVASRPSRTTRAWWPVELAQRRERALGAPLLERADQGVQDDDDGDHRGVARVSERKRDPGGQQQQVDQRTRELAQEDRRQRATLGCGKALGPKRARRRCTSACERPRVALDETGGERLFGAEGVPVPPDLVRRTPGRPGRHRIAMGPASPRSAARPTAAPKSAARITVGRSTASGTSSPRW